MLVRPFHISAPTRTIVAPFREQLTICQERPKSVGYVHQVGTQRVIGRIHVMTTKSIKATCRLGHTNCVCWASLPNVQPEDLPMQMAQLRQDLLEWFAQGLGKSQAEHQLAAVELKKSKGSTDVCSPIRTCAEVGWLFAGEVTIAPFDRALTG